MAVENKPTCNFIINERTANNYYSIDTRIKDTKYLMEKIEQVKGIKHVAYHDYEIIFEIIKCYDLIKTLSIIQQVAKEYFLNRSLDLWEENPVIYQQNQK